MSEGGGERTLLLTWNYRGLLWSSRRKERFGLITKHLIENQYDFVSLQEVWCHSDYDQLVFAVAPHYPHTVYFPSGVIGSGLAILSRHPISQSFFHRFSLCGAPDRFWHGDWYSGKGIGGVRSTWRGLTVNVYTTHMHAEYASSKDGYVAHRLVQFTEIVQFMEQTSRPEHVALIGGDFNTRPSEFIYKMMVEAGCANRLDRPLVDAWCALYGQRDASACLSDSPAGGTLAHQQEVVGITFKHPSNTFKSASSASKGEGGEGGGRGEEGRENRHQGQRIDYIFYAPRPGVSCTDIRVHAGEAEAGLPCSLSDHQLVSAVFEIDREKLLAARPPTLPISMTLSSDELQEQRPLVEEAIRILEAKRIAVSRWQVFYTVVALIFLLAFIGITIATAITIPNDQLTPLLILALFGVQPAVLVTMFSGIIMARLFLAEERAALSHAINEWKLWLLHHGQLAPAVTIIED